MIHLTNENFEQEVLQCKDTVLVDFWATWCGPCRMLAPTVEAFAENNPQIKVGKIDVDEVRELAIRYKINTIPTLMVFKNGEQTAQSIGVISEQEIEKLVHG